MAIDLSNDINLVTTPSEVVNFDQNTPTTGGVVFTPNTPLTQDVLYVSSTNASTWIYDGEAYITYTVTPTSTTPFYIQDTTIDAGGNKTAPIQHNGYIKAYGFYGSGAGINFLNANYLAAGTVPTARLGTGTADSTTYLRGDGSWAFAGLTKFTEAQSTSSPNATVNVDSITAVASTTDADISIVPKGTGAFLLAIPDNTTTGGNKRGIRAVDLQTERDTANKVASGDYSTITGGRWNLASGTYSLAHGFRNTVSSNYGVALGLDNNVSGSYATALGYGNSVSGQNGFSGGYSNISSSTGTVSLGWSNTSSGAYAFSGGSNNTASGLESVSLGKSNLSSNDNSIALGISNTASGYRGVAIGTLNTSTGTYSYSIGFSNSSNRSNSVAIGSSCSASGDGAFAIGNSANTFLQHNRISFSSGAISTAGDIQKSFYMLKGRSSSATPKTLTSDNSSITTASVIVLQNNNVFRFKGSIVGKQNGTTNIAVWDIDGVIVRGVGVATTTLVGTPTITAVTNLNSWGTPTLTADTTLGGLTVNVIGLAATNIQWVADIETSEVIY